MKMKEKVKVVAIYRVGASLRPTRKDASFEKQRVAVARAADHHHLEVVDEIELIGMTTSEACPTVPGIEGVIRKLRNREIEGVVLADLDRFPSLNNSTGLIILNGLVEAKGRVYTENQVFELGTREGQIEAMLRIMMIHDCRQALISRSVTARAIRSKERPANGREQKSAVKSGTPDGPAAPRA
jgi:hypothetical protein